MTSTAMMREIKSELERLGAENATVRLDEDFEPDVGELVRFELQDAYWHLLPNHFLTLLQELPNGAGSDAIRIAIEQKAMFVWHGPSPKNSRDTST
jgi:hypothetical protein